MTRRMAPPSLAFALLASLTALGFAAPAEAADDAALHAASSAVHGHDCDQAPPGWRITRHTIAPSRNSRVRSYTTIYEVPCTTSAHNIYSVLFGEDDKGLHPIFLPYPRYDLKETHNGNRKGLKVSITGFDTMYMFSDIVIDDKTGLAHTSSRIAPGMADGVLSETYRLADGTLIDARLGLSGKKSVPVKVIWNSGK